MLAKYPFELPKDRPPLTKTEIAQALRWAIEPSSMQ